MNIGEVKLLVDNISNMILYIYPGVITVFLFRFFRDNMKSINNKFTFIVIISISYILNFLTSILFPNRYDDFIYNFSLIILSIVFAWIAHFILYCLENEDGRLRRVLDFFKIYTIVNENEFTIIKNREPAGAYVIVYLKDSTIIYEGYIGNYNCNYKDKNSYIILKRYKKFQQNGKKMILLKDFFNDDTTLESVLIYLDEVKYIELCSHERIVNEYVKSFSKTEQEI